MARPRKTKGGVRIDPKTGKADSGRPSVMTPEIIAKLEQAFSFDATNAEACMYAGISEVTLWRYLNGNEEFCNKVKLLRSKPVLAARESVIRSMKNDGALALKYLERKRKDEFSTRVEQTGKDGEALVNAEIEVSRETLENVAKNILENKKIKIIPPTNKK